MAIVWLIGFIILDAILINLLQKIPKKKEFTKQDLARELKERCPFDDEEGKAYWNMHTEKTLLRFGGNYNLERKLLVRRWFIKNRWDQMRRDIEKNKKSI